MHKVSIVGIDNTGKTSIVKSLEEVADEVKFHLKTTNY